MPELPSGMTPAAIRDALIDGDRVDFVADYEAAMAEATRTLELGPVLELLRDWYPTAVLTKRMGSDAYRRMLATAEEIQRTGTSSTERSRSEMDELLRRRLGGTE